LVGVRDVLRGEPMHGVVTNRGAILADIRSKELHAQQKATCMKDSGFLLPSG